MRKFLLSSFLIAFLFYGCDQDNSPTGPSDGQTFTYLHGRIEGWNSGTGKILSFCVYPVSLSKTEIKKDGSFALQCPRPPATLLANVDDSFFSPYLSISDSSAKFAYAFLCVNSGGKEIGEAVQSDRKTKDQYYLEDIGSFIIGYWYFDRAVTLIGFSETREGNKDARYNYNIKASTGWNLITKSLKQNSAQAKVYQVTSGAGAPSNYYFIPYSSLHKGPLFSPSVLLRK